MAKYKSMTWNLMYIGAVLCALICVAIVYQIIMTQDTSDEWIIWTCVIIGFSLFGFGFLYESKHRDQESQTEAQPKGSEQKSA